MKLLFTILCLSIAQIQADGVYGAVSQHKACGSHKTADPNDMLADGTLTGADGITRAGNGGDLTTDGTDGTDKTDGTDETDKTDKTDGTDKTGSTESGAQEAAVKTGSNDDLVGSDGSNVATTSNGDRNDGFSLSTAAIAIIALIGAICIVVGVIMIRKRRSTYDPSKEFDEEEYVITQSGLVSEAPSYSHSIAIYSDVSSDQSAIYTVADTASEFNTDMNTSEVFSIDDSETESFAESEFSYSDASDFMSSIVSEDDESIGYHL